MHYKTITLELIQDLPELYEHLRSGKRLLPAMDSYSIDLKARHEAWKETIARTQPGSDPRQVAAEALELAIQELRDLLLCVSPKGEAEPTTDTAKGRPKRATPPE